MESSVVFASTHPPQEGHIVQTPLGFHGTTTKGVYTTATKRDEPGAENEFHKPKIQRSIFQFL